MQRSLLLLYFNALLLIWGCDSAPSDDNGGGEPPNNSYLELKLVPTQSFQVISGFGASDAWSVQFAGKNWPAQKRGQMADLLFSKEFKSNGDPKGIGLNSWRFNLGAGSAAQGASSGIQDEWRRAESFLTPNGYDWSVQEGQRNFMLEALSRGVDHFTAFSNSPPVEMTANGKAHSSGGNSANLPQEKYTEYADFLVQCLD